MMTIAELKAEVARLEGRQVGRVGVAGCGPGLPRDQRRRGGGDRPVVRPARRIRDVGGALLGR